MLDFAACDADNHYYEATDAFTRPHRTDDGQALHAVGRARTVDSVCWSAGRSTTSSRTRRSTRWPSPARCRRSSKAPNSRAKMSRASSVSSSRSDAEYRDRDARLAVMDRAGSRGGVAVPDARRRYGTVAAARPRRDHRCFPRRSIDGSTTTGASRIKGRLFAAPYLSLVDLDAAIAELDWALARGARIICVRTAPVDDGQPDDLSILGSSSTPSGLESPKRGSSPRSTAATPATRITSPSGSPPRRVERSSPRRCNASSRRTGRHPRRWPPRSVTRCSIATLDCVSRSSRTAPRGCVDLLKKLDLAATQSGGWFSERPSDTFRRHVWVTPFWEDDPARSGGVDRRRADAVRHPIGPTPKALPNLSAMPVRSRRSATTPCTASCATTSAN